MIKPILFFLFTIVASIVVSQPNIRTYGSYFGGDMAEFVLGMVYDETGKYYVAGTTTSEDLPTNSMSYQMNHGGDASNDGFIACFNSDNTISWCTYVGGSDFDAIRDLEVSNGYLYFCGETWSQDLEGTPDSYQSNLLGTTDAFIGKISLQGEMQWLTLYGGNGHTQATGITVSNNKVLCSGDSDVTQSGFATNNALQPSNNGSFDGFLLELTADGSRQYCTFFGGNGDDAFSKLVADPAGNIYLSGYTNSSNLMTTPGAMQLTYGGNDDIAIVKLTQDYSLEWCTYYGGYLTDYINAIDMSTETGNLWITGWTTSPNLEMSSNQLTNQEAILAASGYVLEMSPDGERIWSSYIKSTADLRVSDVAEMNDKIVLVGHTMGNDLPVSTNAMQSSNAGIRDAFIMVVGANHTLDYCSYYGGENEERDSFIAVHGNLLTISGNTFSSTGMTTAEAYSNVLNGNQDGFIAIFDSETFVENFYQNTNNITLHPNPASSFINLTSNDKLERISIVDISGRVVVSQNIFAASSAVIDIQPLTAGVYLLQAYTEKGISTTKLVVE